MSRITTVHINSADRTNGSVSDFTYNISPLGLNKIKGWYLQSATIPYSYYTFSLDYMGVNGLDIIIEHGAQITVTLDPGNYTITQLTAALKAKLDAATPSVWSVTYNSVTQRLRLQDTTGGFLWFYASQMNTNLNYALGAGNVDIPVTPSGGGPFVDLPFPVALNGAQNLYVESNVLNVGQRCAVFKGQKRAIVAEIPVNVPPGGVTVYRDTNVTRVAMENVSLSNVDIRLLDDHGNAVQMNSKDWQLSIVFISED